MNTLNNTSPETPMDDIYTRVLDAFTKDPNSAPRTASFVGAPADFNKLSYEITDDLEIKLVIFGQHFTAQAHRRDALLETLENLLNDYEQKALALDIQEGNCG